jgi:hypothetical protein
MIGTAGPGLTSCLIRSTIRLWRLVSQLAKTAPLFEAQPILDEPAIVGVTVSDIWLQSTRRG